MTKRNKAIKEQLRPALALGRRIQRSTQRLIYGDKYVEKVFTQFYDSNHWRDDDSVSGKGSNLAQTEEIRRQLPSLVKELNIKTILDIPCGDFYWMKSAGIEWQQYIGADIVSALVTSNNENYADEKTSFVKLDAIKSSLPKVDVILCRDCLVHFSSKDVITALKNFKASGSTYLLTTSFMDRKHNVEIETGGWRPLNLEAAPFNLPHPRKVINEKCTQDNGIYPDKCLNLWKLSELTL